MQGRRLSQGEDWMVHAREVLQRPPVLIGIAAAFVLLIGMIAFALGRRQPQPVQPQIASSATPAVVQKSNPAPQPPSPSEEVPAVTIRSLPPRSPAVNAPLNAPGTVTVTPGVDAPATTPITPGMEPTPPDAPFSGIEVNPETEPVQVPRVETPPAQPEPAPEPEVRPRPRPRPSPSIARATGRLNLYFDADSSTFNRGERRAPLRVEVYIDGQKVLEDSDPEKREFEITDIPEGDHEITIVPHIGGAQSRPRRMRVNIDANSRSRFGAVLRREDGEARISKFRPRD
jgi:hypothetical protein